ncbi:YdjY domain-containing protein [uncultured Desulfobacter sp.]|uniref:YdjY domain-containing protein n=1 Tax=uncultured Desulfobacter sp. TaxID=240139 RepID=UPI0029C7C542|nr:YdjY domain-containing protein [uncultured Desulfobacter sp.]
MILKPFIFKLLLFFMIMAAAISHAPNSISASEKHFPADLVKQEEINRQHPPIPFIDTSSPKIKKIGKDTLQIGSVLLDKKERFIKLSGKINMRDGAVEYIACTPYGKLHESVLSIDADPYHIQIALLLLRAVPGNRPIEFQGAEQTPCGDPVALTVSWQNMGKDRVNYPIEKLLLNINSNETMEKADWVFVGSQMIDGQFMAQQEGSIIASFHDPFALIDHRSISGSDDTFFHANKRILPPVGMPVELIIHTVPDDAVRDRTRCKTIGEINNGKK